MISYRQADIIDRIKPRFRWIFDSNADLNIFVTEETEDAVLAQGKWNASAAQKVNGIHRRPGWVLAVRGSMQNESVWTKDGGRKDIFYNGKFVGKVHSITPDGYVMVNKENLVMKIDPVKVMVTKADGKVLELRDI